MKNKIIVSFTLVFSGFIGLQAQQTYPFQNADLTIEQRVNNVLSLLTLEEKVAFILDYNAPRLNISSPGSAEGIHQALVKPPQMGAKPIPTTSFSQVYGMGATWNPELMKKAGNVMGYEARYATQNEKYKLASLMLWGPTTDLARDPRWGRNDESFSEDPFLVGTMATALTKGIQGDNPNYWMAGSLLKHFFANSNETTRARSSSDFNNRIMREYYAAPFQMTFIQGGAKSYMASYNAWNSVPMTVHPILKEVVAKEWGADWVISSDFLSIGHGVNQHKYFKTREEVVAAAIKVGMNQFLDFPGLIKVDLDKALAAELVTETDIDKAIRGKIKAALKLGLLDNSDKNPYKTIGINGESEPWNSEKHKAVALQVARESVVLLKNDKNTLPLNKENVKTIAVIGPHADSVLFDFYSGATPYAISVLQGLKNKLGSNVNVNFVPNNEYNAAVNAAKAADYVIVVIGNDPMCGTKNLGEAFNHDGSTKECLECGEGREGRDRQSLDLPAEDLAKEVFAVNPKTIVVLTSSFPYAINWSQAHVPAILHITHAAQEQGSAIADVLFGDYNPAGRLVQTWPKSLDQLPRMMDYDITNGRTYMYFRGEPLYHFGHGLSYTQFQYTNLKLSSATMPKTGSITVSADLKNTGSRDGDEVVQLYIQHPQSKVIRPVKALKGFQRVNLKAGETKKVTFMLNAESLAWWNDKISGWEVEEGSVKVLMGSSSQTIKLQNTFTVSK
ncbi:glycoside hydrolase family 3 C-terminal domain-containing protein [Runella aurantiaca]|uniref:Beta-glucosidase n=1 Tax=Runella aurantiaca TaxID=2282308 RepID=A0A369IE78_9BACT|nr:glycoside hydrolase family 3 C-terminal domain-containing protein [Runella aurantiaca]RDB05803.1 beta-glucosidase [Runella aurantiaca]